MLTGLPEALGAHLQPFSRFFVSRTRDVSEIFYGYVRGLFQSERGNMLRMSEVNAVNHQALQHMLTTDGVDWAGLARQIATDVNALLGGDEAVALIDESAVAKKGAASAGVARQWNGRLGKVDNSQVGVFMALCRGTMASLFDSRLYLPSPGFRMRIAASAPRFRSRRGCSVPRPTWPWTWWMRRIATACATFGALYESMLREMRDAAGDSGEFYTPRAVVRFMVAAADPRLGEVVLDPASGTGGFLVEAFMHLHRQVHNVTDHKQLQERSILGCEPKPLPYMLCQMMNLLLHGLDAPQIDPGNALRHKLTEIGEKERVDVILTNPPFGGEEEKGIQGNFPEDKQTAETALLFLQLIMRKLRKHPSPASGGGAGGEGKPPARAAVVVPNGTLFGDGVCARIKEELLRDFNLHTIVRLPNGVFAPYTSIPTNLLFFDRAGPTKEVWYYDQPLPAGRKNYTKTQPLQYEEFQPCLDWWGGPSREGRVENERAWKVPVAELLAANCNLDRKNPSAKADITHLPPEELVASILDKERRIAEIMGRIQGMLAEEK